MDGRTVRVSGQLDRHRELAEVKTERGRRTFGLPELAMFALRGQRVQQARERIAAGARWQDAGFVFATHRLARDAAEAVRGSHRSRTQETERAVHQTVLATVFRVQLVLRIITVTDTALRQEGLILAALSAHLALYLETVGEHRSSAARLPQLRDLLLERVAELHALQAARTIVEARYLGGQTALFPDAVRDWADQVQRSEETAVMTLRLAELDGVPAPDEARQGGHRRGAGRDLCGGPRRAGPDQGAR